MPIQPISFPALTPQQTNPFQAGIQQGIDSYGALQQALLAAQKAKIAEAQAKYASPMAEQELQKALLYNKYYGPDMQSQIGLRGAQAGEANARIGLIGAQQGETNARTGLIGQETKYYPLNEAIKAQESQRLTSRFGQAYQLHSALSNMDASSRNLWVSMHPKEYTQMLNDMGNQASMKQNDIVGQILPKYFPDIVNKNQQGQQQSSQFTANNQVTPPYENSAASFQTKPEEIEALQNNLQHQANKKGAGAQISRRAESAATLEIWLNQNKQKYNQALLDASKYAGLIGKGDKKFEQIRPRNSEAYQNLQWFDTVFVPTMSNNIRMMEGLSSSNKQREELRNLSDALDNWKLDPESALKVFNKQMSTIQDISDSVFQGAEPAVKGTYRKTYNIPRGHGDYVNKPIKVIRDNNGRLIMGSS